MSDQQTLVNISEDPFFLNGFCDLKCDYSFYYQLSICRVHPNSGNTSLHFTYEANSNGTKQVLYNGIEYNVSGIFIYSPSLHYFDGNQVEAEIQIVHQAVLGNGSPLVVCIPITSSSGSIPNYKGTHLVEDMITNAVNVINTTNRIENELNTEISSANRELTNLKNNDMIKSGSGIANVGNKIKNSFENLGRRIARRPTQSNNTSSIENQLSTLQDQLQRVENQVDHNLNQPQVLNITNYTLEYLVPGKTPFFSYTNTNDNAYYIVYGMNNAIFVDSTVMQNLQSVVSPYYTNPTYNDTIVSPNITASIYPLFLNQTGAVNLLTTNLSDEIYIDCQPTGSSTEQTNVTTSTTSSTTLQKSSTLFFIYVVFFLFVLFLIYMIFSYITHPDKKNFSIGSIKNPFT
jgi:hypothetical protein